MEGDRRGPSDLPDPSPGGEPAGGMIGILRQVRRLEREAAERAPRPWVILLAIGLGLLAISLVHPKRSHEAVPRTAAGRSAPVDEGPGPLFTGALELVPASRTSGPAEVISSALPPEPPGLPEGTETSRSAELPARERGRLLDPSPFARAPPPPLPA